jgi:hydrogenase maturation protein HypF
MIVDWEPLMRAIIQDARDEIPLARISTKFHNTLVEIIVEVARRVSEKRVILTGGCFQNKFLLEHTVRRLEAEGFRPYWHQRVPPNDGGIALGQIFAASRLLKAGVEG